MSDHQACAAAGLPPPELVTVRGEEVTIAGVECYVAGSGSLCVVVGYDVFGFKVKNTRHNVDELARIIPDSTDFFRGATASDAALTGEAIGKFIQDYGSFEVVKTDLAVPGNLATGVKFSDLAAKSPLEAWEATPFDGKVQILIAIGLAEFHSEFGAPYKTHYTKGGSFPGNQLNFLGDSKWEDVWGGKVISATSAKTDAHRRDAAAPSPRDAGPGAA
ncbi:chlorophyll A-B binding protein [Aureococcus anophagefferens]|nr:chlorophyll A-B binding protein [Aureococcus anophagefferens]